MGFAWQPDKRGGGKFGDLYRDGDGVARGFYRRSAVWTTLRSPAGRHANRGQRGAHASRLADAPPRASWRSGPERWRRWA